MSAAAELDAGAAGQAMGAEAATGAAGAADRYTGAKAAVAADHYRFFTFGEHGRTESLADLHRDAGIERLSDDAANVVSLEDTGRESQHFYRKSVEG